MNPMIKAIFRPARLFLVLSVLIGAPAAQGAVEMFLKVEDIEGESNDAAHRRWIDIAAWSWNISNSGSIHSGGGGGAGKAAFADLTITKWVDRSTPHLMLAAASGKHFKNAVLVVRRAGHRPVEFLEIRLTEVLVTSVATGASGEENRLTETITLNFGKVEVDYVPQKPDGSEDSKVPFQWDLRTNTGG